LSDVAKEEQISGGKKTLEYILNINNYNGNELRHNGVAKHDSDMLLVALELFNSSSIKSSEFFLAFLIY
jgi:hypothetical protein